MRAIAILNDHDENALNVSKIIGMLMTNCVASNIYVFSDMPNGSFNMAHESVSCTNICFPSTCDNIPKKRNWINQYFKTQQFDGTLYVISDTIKFLKDPTQFFNELENMMNILDYPVWFNTDCDSCNYVYNKYCPRISINLDKAEYQKLNLPTIYFTSHANTAIMAYDFSKVTDDLLKFDERFSIPMYYIIEYMARRRNTKSQDSLFFMNQYITIPSEHGIFTDTLNNKEHDQTVMKRENELFMSMNLNYSPDGNFDKLLELVYNKLNSKI